MSEKRFTHQRTDDYNFSDILDNGKWIGICHVDCEDDFVDKFNELNDENKLLLRKNGAMEEEIECLSEENEQLKQQLKEYKQPNCKKCIEYSQDGVGDYCMSEKGLLGNAWKMFPYEWDYGNAKNCKEYEE